MSEFKFKTVRDDKNHRFKDVYVRQHANQLASVSVNLSCASCMANRANSSYSQSSYFGDLLHIFVSRKTSTGVTFRHIAPLNRFSKILEHNKNVELLF